MRISPGKDSKDLALVGGVVSPEEFDYFHELVYIQEISRCSQRGCGDGLQSGAVIGLLPIMNFGSPELKSKIIPEVLSGKKFICLGISEAFSGSNVAGL